jgi:hypothetical protein
MYHGTVVQKSEIYEGRYCRMEDRIEPEIELNDATGKSYGICLIEILVQSWYHRVINLITR